MDIFTEKGKKFACNFNRTETELINQQLKSRLIGGIQKNHPLELSVQNSSFITTTYQQLVVEWTNQDNNLPSRNNNNDIILNYTFFFNLKKTEI